MLQVVNSIRYSHNSATFTLAGGPEECLWWTVIQKVLVYMGNQANYTPPYHTRQYLDFVFDIACGGDTVGLVLAPKFLSRRSSMIATLLCDQPSFDEAEMKARQV